MARDDHRGPGRHHVTTRGPCVCPRTTGEHFGSLLAPRIAAHAETQGFAPGWSLALTTSDEQGRTWDFSRHDCRERARKLLRKTRPLLLVGSHMCTWFSVLQQLNKCKKDPEEWEKGFQRAVEHIKFVFELYDMQVRGGRYFSTNISYCDELETPGGGGILR